MSERLERLINLVIALRETRVPMTAEEIRTRVAGYGQANLAAFRRMFERDKDSLKRLGIPIRKEYTDRLRDREGYRIHASDYDLEPIALEPDELAALALAVRVTGLDEGRALRKLEVDAGVSADDVLDDDAMRAAVAVTLDAPHRDAMLRAQMQGRRVQFDYRRPTSAAETRTVDPAGLVHRAGRWYVVGHDADRQAKRVFRLDRIVGNVAEVGEAVAPPETVSVDDVLPETEPVDAEVAAVPAAEWLVARRAQGPGRESDDGRRAYTVPARDGDELLGWILRLGPDVEVLGPQEFRARVVAALDRLLEQAP